MKYLILISVLIGSITSLALEERELKVISFVKVNPSNARDNSAELCGRLMGPITVNDRIVITVDPGKNQGFYTTLPDNTGHFCQVVRTLYGSATVTAQSFGNPFKLTSKAQVQK